MFEEAKYDLEDQGSILREFLSCSEEEYPILLLSSEKGNRDHELIKKMMWADDDFCKSVSTCKIVNLSETSFPMMLKEHFGTGSGISLHLIDDNGELFTSIDHITNPALAAQQIREAVSSYRSRTATLDALKANPNDPHANLDAVFLFTFQKRMHASIMSFRKAVPTGLWQGRLAEAALRVGDLCSFLGDYETAAELYDQVLHSDAEADTRRSAWFKLILCYMHMQKFEEAEKLGASNFIDEFSETNPFNG